MSSFLRTLRFFVMPITMLPGESIFILYALAAALAFPAWIFQERLGFGFWQTMVCSVATVYLCWTALYLFGAVAVQAVRPYRPAVSYALPNAAGLAFTLATCGVRLMFFQDRNVLLDSTMGALSLVVWSSMIGIVRRQHRAVNMILMKN